MRCHRGAASRGAHVAGRPACMATEATTRTRIAGSCAGAASVRTSRDGGRRMGAGWERIAGTWSGRCRGCTTSGGCEFASLDAHGGETGNDSTILTIISLPPDVDFVLVFKVFLSLSQLVLFSHYVRESWNYTTPFQRVNSMRTGILMRRYDRRIPIFPA